VSFQQLIVPLFVTQLIVDLFVLLPETESTVWLQQGRVF
jgi:hypothetical protein